MIDVCRTARENLDAYHDDTTHVFRFLSRYVTPTRHNASSPSYKFRVAWRFRLDRLFLSYIRVHNRDNPEYPRLEKNVSSTLPVAKS